MALLPIYETPDPMLRQISTPVDKVDDELRALIKDMFETMYAAPGIGLAAVQVGVPKRLLVMDLQEPEDPDDPESKPVKEPRVFVNPEILSHSDHDRGRVAAAEHRSPARRRNGPARPGGREPADLRGAGRGAHP